MVNACNTEKNVKCRVEMHGQMNLKYSQNLLILHVYIPSKSFIFVSFSVVFAIIDWFCVLMCVCVFGKCVHAEFLMKGGIL